MTSSFRARTAQLIPILNLCCLGIKAASCYPAYFPSTLTPVSDADSVACVSMEAKARSRPLWARGGRCFAGFLDPTVQGKKTPVPPRGILFGLNTIGRTGASITTGVRSTPHLVMVSIVSYPPRAPFGIAYGLGMFGCHRVMAPATELVGEDWPGLASGRTLKNVMLTLLLGDGHMTCLATSALFPLITKRDLQDYRKSRNKSTCPLVIT